MNENFIATIYQKIFLSENILVFRRVAIVQNLVINFDSEVEQGIFYDGDGKRIILDFMEDEYTFVSDDNYCYGYPMTLKILQETYPECIDENDLLRKYYEEISEVVNIGYYDTEKDRVKIFVTNEKILKEHESDELFKNFDISYESEDDEVITFPVSDLKKLENLIKQKKYKEVENEIRDLSKNIDLVNGIVDDFAVSLNEPEIEKNEFREVVDKKIVENKDIPKEQLEDLLRELNELVGLDNVKMEIYKLIKYLAFQHKSQQYLKIDKPNLHMFFTGNPGTGKTTVARMLSKIFYSLGYVKKKNFAEVTPEKLIAGYVGQTAIKTREFLDKNKGGVIFIDEAYILSGEAQNFGGEALVEILKELEKNETIFIFAGYKDEMEQFKEMNPGLESRIGYYLKYEDYTPEQLYSIFVSKVEKMGFIVEDALKEKVMNSILAAKENAKFGNGRYIDKLISKLVLEHALDIDKYETKEDLITLKEKDFNQNVEETLSSKQKVKKIGF